MRPLLLAAGYVNVDITATLARVPGFGERVTVEKISRSPGGMTANMACAASRLGMAVRFFGQVGEDAEGELSVAELESFGVDTSGITKTGERTTTSLIFVGPDGDRAIVSEPVVFDYGSLERAVKKAANVERACLHVDGYRFPDVLPILRHASERGLATSADLDGMESSDFLRLLPEIADTLDVVLLNRRLAATLNTDLVEAARAIVGLGARVVAVTLGDRGAVVADEDSHELLAAHRVMAVDATGAGDVFAAAFLAATMEGNDIREAGRFAVAASAISVRGAGARGRLPEREEVERLVSSTEVYPGVQGERSNER